MDYRQFPNLWLGFYAQKLTVSASTPEAALFADAAAEGPFVYVGEADRDRAHKLHKAFDEYMSAALDGAFNKGRASVVDEVAVKNAEIEALEARIDMLQIEVETLRPMPTPEDMGVKDEPSPEPESIETTEPTEE